MTGDEITCRACMHNWIKSTAGLESCPKCGSYLWRYAKPTKEN